MAAVRLICCAAKFRAPPFGHSSASQRSLACERFLNKEGLELLKERCPRHAQMTLERTVQINTARPPHVVLEKVRQVVHQQCRFKINVQKLR